MFRFAFLITLCLSSAFSATYVSKPGAQGGDGSKSRPWPALQECIEHGHLNKLKAGDTLFLLEGYHGHAVFTGKNEGMVTIAGVPGQDVRLSRLSLKNGDKWHIKDMRISASFGEPYKGGMVGIDGGMNIIEGCEVFGVDDHKGMDVAAWKAINSGVFIGRNSKGSIIRNCYVRNTRFAMGLDGYDSIAEGNIIENYSADGIRMTRDNQIARYNVIKGAFAGMGQGDKNHDDAIQCFLFNRGTGTMRNLTINYNYIMGFGGHEEPFAATNQGIGLFDGPLIDFHLEGNVVMVGQWHGLSVYDGQNCTIKNNVVWTDFKSKAQAWIMLGSKQKKSKDNTVTDNYASRFKLRQPGTVESNNKKVTKQISDQAKADLEKRISDLYSPYHRVAKRHRFTGVVVKDVPDAEGKSKSKSKASEKKAVKKVHLKDGELDKFTLRLQEKLDALLENARFKPRFIYSVFRQEVVVIERKSNKYALLVPKLGSSMVVPLFEKIKLVDALQLAEAMVSEQDQESNALLAFFLFANKNPSKAKRYLAKSGSFKNDVLEAIEGH